MQKLLEIKRNNIIERIHFGFVGLYDKSFGFIAPGYKNELFYMRSCAKPLQASILDSFGVFKKFSLTNEEISIICSSHTASEFHLSLIKNILEKGNLSHSFLQCGAHFPIDKKSSCYLIQNKIIPCALHNNCSGKHAGFLLGCKLKNWDLSSYLDFDHPLQKSIKKRIFDYCSLENKDEIISKDGCGAPIWAMSLSNMAQGFLRCFENHPKIKNAIISHPYAAGGYERIDSEIIQASNGKLIAKVGAEGLLMVYNEKKQQVLIVKILDSNEQARAIVTLEGILALGWLDIEKINKTKLVDFYNLEIKTHSNEIIGHIKTYFDWSLLK